MSLDFANARHPLPRIATALMLSTVASCSGGDFCRTRDYGCASSAPDGGSGASGRSGNAGTGASGSQVMGNGGGAGASNERASAGHAGDVAPTREGSAGEAGNGGEGGMSGAGTGGNPTCDPTKSPHDEPCLVANDYAIFVTPRGNDGATGQKDDPVKTIARALSLAYSADKLIVVCATSGTFSEQVNISAALDGARIYGGFDCNTWESTTTKTVVASTQTTALRVDGLSTGLTIEDFAFTAADAKTAGGSSLGAFVTNSKNVQLTRVSITAGKGMDGTNGVGTSTPAAMGASGSAGTDACMATSQPNPGGTAVESPCDGAGSGSVGGKGGDGGSNDSSGQNGDDGMPTSLGAGAAGIGETGTWSCATGRGEDGNPGVSKSPATGASTIGTLTMSGFDGTSGTDGENGTPGQGGGGGGGAKAPTTCASNPRTGASGGSGGGGGCGGKGGTAGAAGGSSVALAVLNSKVTLDTVNLVAGDAGKGGDGGAGQQGGSGGAAGPLASGGMANDSCDGGRGGKGGNGGSGGGAAGGISVGIAWSGSAAPTQTSVTFTEGALGAKGKGGSAGTNDGIDGIAQDIWQSP